VLVIKQCSIIHIRRLVASPVLTDFVSGSISCLGIGKLQYPGSVDSEHSEGMVMRGGRPQLGGESLG